MKETTTLDKIEINNDWTDEEILHRNTLLLLMNQLSTLQINIAAELEQIYKDHKVYNFAIKHNHKNIKKLLAENTSNTFFKRMNREQELLYGDDAEVLERIIYQWAGLKVPDDAYIRADSLDLTLAAKLCWEIAFNRGKINNYTSDLMQFKAIKDELNELKTASLNPSIHIEGFSEQEEEAADVIISTLTFLHKKGTNVNNLLQKKIEYNIKRKD